MDAPIEISNVHFTLAATRDVENGLLGWIKCLLNGSIHLDGIALRRTKGGRLTLSYPSREDSSGKRYFHLRPKDNDVRREIERQIFQAMGIMEKLS